MRPNKWHAYWAALAAAMLAVNLWRNRRKYHAEVLAVVHGQEPRRHHAGMSPRHLLPASADRVFGLVAGPVRLGRAHLEDHVLGAGGHHAGRRRRLVPRGRADRRACSPSTSLPAGSCITGGALERTGVISCIFSGESDGAGAGTGPVGRGPFTVRPRSRRQCVAIMLAQHPPRIEAQRQCDLRQGTGSSPRA